MNEYEFLDRLRDIRTTFESLSKIGSEFSADYSSEAQNLIKEEIWQIYRMGIILLPPESKEKRCPKCGYKL